MLFAEEKIEIVAKNVERNDNVITATGEAVAVGGGYFIRADRLVYDKNRSLAEGFGDIFALKESSIFTVSDYVKYYIDEKKGYFDKFFLQDEKNNVWISSNEATSKDKVYSVNNAVSSSCSFTDPDWRIAYDEGEFDSKSNVMSLKNAVIYIKNIPVLYAPYFSFSTDKTRRSGLLKPDIGVKGNEGFIYIQPIYYVKSPDSSWDNEFSPQIRTKRGYGFTDTLRFVDSKYSQGYIKGGYFADRPSYKNEYNLKYGSHYGFTFFYDREKLFSSADKTQDEDDGLYVNINYLNDIDYVNLQSRDNLRDNVADKITSSKVNYYFKKESDYLGAYLKYYIDTSKTSNDDTIQEYPKLQYHREIGSIGLKDLMYSFDIGGVRFDRRSGLNALQTQAFLPVSYTKRFFDDFFGVSLIENLYANRVGFSKGEGERLKEYSFYSATHKTKIFTNLQKTYESLIHTIDAELVYTNPGFKKETNRPLVQNELTTVVTSSAEKENSSFKLAQFFYDKSGSLLFSHRLTQPIYHDSLEVDYKYGELENEVFVKLSNEISLSADVFYSHKNNLIAASTSTIAYAGKDEAYSLSHVYKDRDVLASQKQRESYFSFNGSKGIGGGYEIFGSYEYDDKKRETRAWSVGAALKKRCINYSISLKNEITPILTSAETSSLRNYIIYFRVNLIPLGGLNQSYSISGKK